MSVAHQATIGLFESTSKHWLSGRSGQGHFTVPTRAMTNGLVKYVLVELSMKSSSRRKGACICEHEIATRDTHFLCDTHSYLCLHFSSPSAIPTAFMRLHYSYHNTGILDSTMACSHNVSAVYDCIRFFSNCNSFVSSASTLSDMYGPTAITKNKKSC
jgi:hypothetical protein